MKKKRDFFFIPPEVGHLLLIYLQDSDKQMKKQMLEDLRLT